MKTVKLVLLFIYRHRNIFGTLKIGENNPEIANLEFKSYGSYENHVFLPTEQGGTNTNVRWYIKFKTQILRYD